MNKIQFAKLKIYEYVDELFLCISDLVSSNIEELMNNDSHGLDRKELVIVLYEMFSEHNLVAKSEKKGLFTPTLDEIESAIGETKDMMYFSNNTFYGLTTGALEEYRKLKALHHENT